MAAGLEGAKNYLVSVAERTFGIDAHKRWQGYAEKYYLSPTDPFTEAFKEHRKIGGVLALVSQIAFPATTDYTARVSEEVNNHNFPFSYPIFMARYGIERMAAEAIRLVVVMPAIVHNPIEFALYQLGANIATHVGLDILEAGINRIPRFRPPTAAALAV